MGFRVSFQQRTHHFEKPQKAHPGSLRVCWASKVLGLRVGVEGVLGLGFRVWVLGGCEFIYNHIPTPRRPLSSCFPFDPPLLLHSHRIYGDLPNVGAPN